MKVDTQNIPAPFEQLYAAALGWPQNWKTQEIAKKRYPWRLPHMQGNGIITPDADMGNNVTIAQFNIRKLFKRAIYYFHKCPDEGGVEPPNYGYRSKAWWYNASLGDGLDYYQYFIQQTMIIFLAGRIPDWCRLPVAQDTFSVESWPDGVNGNSPLTNWGNIPGQGRYAYITTDSDGKYLWIPARTAYNEAMEELDTTIFEYFIVAGAWDETTLTWNNQPGSAGKIGLKTISTQWKYFSIPTPPVDDICIKMKSVASCQITHSKEWGPAPKYYPFFHDFPASSYELELTPP